MATQPSPRLNLTQLKLQAKELLQAHRTGAATAVVRLQRYLPGLAQADKVQMRAYDLALSQAQLVIARENGFDSWPKLKQHIAAANAVPKSRFDQAVEAIITGAADALQGLLQDEPELVQARSQSGHRAQLLHYVAANGIENELQRSPANAVEVACILLQAGAQVDALAETYGGGSRQTTLNLLVSSVHPARAGVQADLVEVLADAGAALEGLKDDGSPLQTAIDFGYLATARMLVAKGARIRSLRAAAGLGRLDWMEDFFAAAPKGDLSREMAGALAAACRHGQVEAASFLLDRGADINAQPGKSGTALHEAIFANRIDVARLLLQHGASLDVEHAVYAATPLDFASYNGRRAMVEMLLQHGAAELQKPLYSAVQQGHGEITRLLLLRGAAVEAARQLARERGDEGMLALLEEIGKESLENSNKE